MNYQEILLYLKNGMLKNGMVWSNEIGKEHDVSIFFFVCDIYKLFVLRLNDNYYEIMSIL